MWEFIILEQVKNIPYFKQTYINFRLWLFFLSFGHKMWTCLKLQTQETFFNLYLSKSILIWTCIVPLSISKYLYLSLNRVGNDKSILSILLGYPFIESNCATRVNMSAYVLMCQWKYIFIVVPMNSLLSERLWSSSCLIYKLEMIHMIRSLASDKGTNWW